MYESILLSDNFAEELLVFFYYSPGYHLSGCMYTTRHPKIAVTPFSRFYFCVMICCRIWKFESTFEKKPIKSENMSFTYYDVQFTCGNRIHTYAKQMSDPHVALFFFFPYLTVHVRHFHEGTSTFLSLRISADADMWLLAFTVRST